MTNRSKTGKRVQIYLDARHVNWWETLPRWERSQIVAQALDLYRESKSTAQDSHSDPPPETDVPH
jgi:hypothetical protein